LLIVVVVVVVLGHGSMLAKAFPWGEEAGTEEPPSALFVPKISRTKDDDEDEDDSGRKESRREGLCILILISCYS
jgi:hypothetical protein